MANSSAGSRAGVLGRVQLRDGLLNMTKGVKTDINKVAADTALNAAIIAKNTGQNTIMTTPSDLSIKPKDNRYWHGDMYNNFDAQVTQTGNKITVKYGWLANKKNYFLIQEDGGTVQTKHRGAVTISGMHALTNAQMAVERYLAGKGIK